MDRLGRKKRKLRETVFDIADLDPRSEALFKRLEDHIEQSEIPSEEGDLLADVSALKRLVDMSDNRSQRVWREINSFLCSTKAKNEQQDALFRLLMNIDSRRYEWSWTDQRKISEQMQNIKAIGNLADKLKKELVNAQNGSVSDFLSWWSTSEAQKELPIEAFVKGKSDTNLKGHFAWYLQRKVLRPNQNASVELLIRLASLAEAAKQYPKSKKEVTPISGLKSQKRNQFTFFIIRLHSLLQAIFGKSMHVLNANLASLVFNKPFTGNQVKEIINREKERGDISTSKS